MFPVPGWDRALLSVRRMVARRFQGLDVVLTEEAQVALGELAPGPRNRILSTWEQAARRMPKGRPLDRARLLNHLPELLEHIAQSEDALEAGQPIPSADHLGDAHAIERLDEGFDLRDVAEEYGLMRDVL